MNKYHSLFIVVVVMLLVVSKDCLAQHKEIAFVSTTASINVSDNQEEFKPTKIFPTKDPSDSLHYKRNIFGGRFYQKDSVMGKKKMLRLFKDNPKLSKQYRFGRILSPVGPLVSVGGVALSYLALKGNQFSVNVEGQNYDYTVRSVPQLIAGIGAFVGGLCLIEWSNEMLSKSADRYNKNLEKSKKTGLIQHINLGITPSGNLGLWAKF